MRRSTLTAILVVIIIALLGGVGYAYVKKGGSLTSGKIYKDSGSNISDYSAVFLTNGQVYFGKLYSSPSAKTVDLRNIYYLQVNQQIQPDQKATDNSSTSTSPNVVLVKLGEELHGPNDRMQINSDQVLFTESLKNDSKVVTAINNYSKK